jgi:hypothetical protein
MQARFKITRDDLSPLLYRALKHVADKRPLLEAGALAIVSRAQGAFSDPQLRPTPWPATKNDSPTPLRKSGMLAQSIRVVSVSSVFSPPR